MVKATSRRESRSSASPISISVDTSEQPGNRKRRRESSDSSPNPTPEERAGWVPAGLNWKWRRVPEQEQAQGPRDFGDLLEVESYESSQLLADAPAVMNVRRELKRVNEKFLAIYQVKALEKSQDLRNDVNQHLAQCCLPVKEWFLKEVEANGCLKLHFKLTDDPEFTTVTEWEWDKPPPYTYVEPDRLMAYKKDFHTGLYAAAALDQLQKYRDCELQAYTYIEQIYESVLQKCLMPPAERSAALREIPPQPPLSEGSRRDLRILLPVLDKNRTLSRGMVSRGIDFCNTRGHRDIAMEAIRLGVKWFHSVLAENRELLEVHQHLKDSKRFICIEDKNWEAGGVKEDNFPLSSKEQWAGVEARGELFELKEFCDKALLARQYIELERAACQKIIKLRAEMLTEQLAGRRRPGETQGYYTRYPQLSKFRKMLSQR